MADWRAQLAANDIDDPSIWKERLPDSPAGTLLERLDSELRCQICQELYRAPVSLPCQHTFCSECIRKAFAKQFSSINRSTRCVSCNAYVDNRNDKGLVPNRALEQAVVVFGKLRNPLLKVLDGVSTQREGSEDTQVSTRRRSSKDRSYVEEDDEEDENYDCLSQEQSIRKSSPQAKRSKPFYGKKKKAELKELCRKEGLPDYGSEEDLRTRHQSFITLYNSECDALHPKSTKDIVDLIMKREKERRRQRHAPTLKDVKASQALTHEMSRNFDQLIANAKHRRSKASKEGSTVGDSDDTVLSAPVDPAKQDISSAHDVVPEVSTTVDDMPRRRDTVTTKSSSHDMEESFLEDGPSPKKRKITSPGPTPSKTVASFSSSCPSSNESSKSSDVSAIPLRPSKRSSVKRPSSGRPSIIGPWTCGLCTYHNTKHTGSLSKCEMCLTPRTAVAVDLT